MSFIVIVIALNDIQVIKPCSTLTEAHTSAIELANEFFSHNGINRFFNGSSIESISDINDYYASGVYHDFGDSVNVVIKEVVL